MNRLVKFFRWGESHCPGWLCILRVALGLFLVYKGIQFMVGIEKIQTLPGDLGTMMYYIMLFHIVVFVHFVGGIFIALGLYTRLADIIQIPVIVGALFLINDQFRTIVSGGSIDQVLLIIALVLTVVLLIFGSGKYSIDSTREDHKVWT